MRPYRIASLPFLVLATLASALPAFSHDRTDAGPRHRVAAMYFHRTKRCPTCKRISAYIEEAITTGFRQELRDTKVSFHFVDFQNQKNAKYTESYNITGPTLVVANVEDGRVTAWKPLLKVWSLVGKKEAFFKYVQDEVHKYMGERYGFKYREVR